MSKNSGQQASYGTPYKMLPTVTVSKSKKPTKIKQLEVTSMSKNSGQQASYGTPYEMLPTVTVSKSKKPTKKIVKRIEKQNQLRMGIKKYGSDSFLFILR
jgi:hypothetical protein